MMSFGLEAKQSYNLEMVSTDGIVNIIENCKYNMRAKVHSLILLLFGLIYILTCNIFNADSQNVLRLISVPQTRCYSEVTVSFHQIYVNHYRPY